MILKNCYNLFINILKALILNILNSSVHIIYKTTHRTQLHQLVLYMIFETEISNYAYFRHNQNNIKHAK